MEAMTNKEMLAKRRIWDKSAPLSEFSTVNDFMRAVLFMIQASASNTPKGKRHHEKSVGLGNTGCWSRGGLHDVSSWRVTGCDCSAYGDQPCGIVGDGIENSFELGSTAELFPSSRRVRWSAPSSAEGPFFIPGEN